MKETNSKNIAPMLMSPIPAWLRNYANVASAINRPSAMMPIRLAIRSATSNIWVVMIICASPLHLRNEDILHHSRFITRASSLALHHSRRLSVPPGQQLVQKISFVLRTNTAANAAFGCTLLEKSCQRSCALEPRRSLSISLRVRRARTSIPRAQRRIQDTQTARVFHKSPAPLTPSRPEIFAAKGSCNVSIQNT
jgi:hypothetical protein